MIPIDLIQSIKKNSPNTLKKFSEIKAARVIKELLVEIVRHTDSVHEGVVIFPKLGRFIIRQQETVQNDENTMTRKITFIRAKLEER